MSERESERERERKRERGREKERERRKERERVRDNAKQTLETPGLAAWMPSQLRILRLEKEASASMALMASIHFSAASTFACSLPLRVSEVCSIVKKDRFTWQKRPIHTLAHLIPPAAVGAL